MQSEYEEKLVAVRRNEIGMATNCALSKADVSELEKLHLLKRCQAILLSIVNDLIAKTPIKFAFVRNSIALHPVHIAKDSNEANVRRFRLVLSNLSDNNGIDENSCDLALHQYREMLVSPKCVEMMNAYD